jgi:hypothetical protein
MYERVRYEAIYPGIDLLYYGNDRQLEYDFVVAAGADPDRIQLTFTGADRLAINAAGELVLHTAAGALAQPKPIVYQEVDGVRRAIEGSYRIAGDRQIGFSVGAYDRTRPLVIDPVLAYSTYFGGGYDDIGWDIAVDAAGNAHITGTRPSVRSPEATDYDAFVAKFGPGGALLWLTDLGDGCEDESRGVALDSTGSVYVTGSLGNCYPFPELQPGAFVAKLNAAGGPIYLFPFSDYWYGGSDLGQAVAVDSAGRAYITGITSSHEFPVTPGAFQPAFAGGIGDGFVVKVNAAGTALLYASYMGGAGYESLNDIALDGSGNAFVTGSTDSRDLPITLGAFQPAHRGWHPGNRNGFVTKVNGSGTALVYSTYLGGSDDDIAQGIAVDTGGRAYVTGVIESIDFPTTAGAFQPVPPGDRWCYYKYCTDAFVTKLNASGSALVYSTYLGGDIFDEGTGIAIDAAGNAYVTGTTLSFTFPTLDAFQPTGAGGDDAFVAKLNAAGSALLYSSYLGGSAQSETGFEGEDRGLRIAADSAGGSAFVIGLTRSPNLPTQAAHQPAFGGGVCGSTGYRCSDAFVAKIGAGGCTFTIAPGSQAFTGAGGPGTVAVTASGPTCARTAASAAPWVTITAGATGSGSGTIGYAVAANGGAARTGTLTIAGQTFTVTQAAAAATVTVTSPNGGEKVFSATPYTLTWTAADATGFDVAVSGDNGVTYAPIAGCTNLAATARSCVWAAPAPLATTARIRVTARDGGGSDASNGAFSIVAGTPRITVSVPNTAVNVGIGSTQQIKWTHNLGAGSRVRIELSRDDGVTFPETLVAAHPNGAASGIYTWPVAAPATAGARARIRVSWNNGPASDVSDASFTIAPIFLTLSGPVVGSSWGLDTTQRLQWTTNLGALDRVHVQLSTAGTTGPFTTLSANVVATLKKADVLVPATPTAMARVRLVWANPPVGFSATALNAGNFTIEPATLAVTAPRAGEVWAIGSSKTIRWTSNLGKLEPVEIRLSRDGGVTYPIVIVATTPADGSHAVTVPAAWGSQTTTRIRVAWLKTPSVAAASPAFTIQP